MRYLTTINQISISISKNSIYKTVVTTGQNRTYHFQGKYQMGQTSGHSKNKLTMMLDISSSGTVVKTLIIIKNSQTTRGNRLHCHFIVSNSNFKQFKFQQTGKISIIKTRILTSPFFKKLPHLLTVSLNCLPIFISQKIPSVVYLFLLLHRILNIYYYYYEKTA